MAAVVNHLHFKEDVDASIFVDSERDLLPEMRAIDGFRGYEVVQVSEREVVLVILADTAETLDRIATEVGSPWMREHVVPLLGRPPERKIGPTLASSIS